MLQSLNLLLHLNFLRVSERLITSHCSFFLFNDLRLIRWIVRSWISTIVVSPLFYHVDIWHTWLNESWRWWKWSWWGPASRHSYVLLIIIVTPRKSNMVHIIKSLPVKSSNDIHNVTKNYWTMECSRLWCITSAINFRPFSLINIKLVNIVKPLLVGINTTKNIDVASTNNCWVPISWLWWRAISSVNFIPVIGEETVLEDIVHCIVAIPTTKYKHWVVKHNRWMSKSI